MAGRLLGERHPGTVPAERRHSFQKFLELLMTQSGGIFEASRFARPCEVSRTTISNYLAVLEATFVVSVLRPFTTHRPVEIVAAPKVYAFDTGFVCYFKGWHELRFDDLGILWGMVLMKFRLSFRPGGFTTGAARGGTRLTSSWREGRKSPSRLSANGRHPILIRGYTSLPAPL